MTVEQTPLDHFHVPPKDHDSALRWLKEMTRVDDLHILNEALEASKKELGMYDMDQAMAFVIQESDKKIDQQRPPVLSNMLVPVVNRDQSVMPKLEVPAIKHQQTDSTDAVIDLTHESENNDIQKAIAMSLQEQHGVFGGQVTTEEQDISRVLEASLADSKAVGTKRKRGEVWQDPLNPHERQRNGDWPVGLKNVGNTCWFAAVIQSLFHLPAFRHLVLNFTLLKDGDNGPKPHSFLFMRELRKLFALMLATERKYVDPTQAIEVVREAFPNSASTDNQQDVSEFSHKLIEWLEDAYKLNSTDHSGENRNSNPMTKLFYGRLKSEGLNADYSSSHEAKFGQYPLQMNGFSEIHESLESAVVAQEIESSGTGTASKFGQETWFTQLPPVLVFELSRFHFNQLLGVPEKIHNRFEFPEVIYMDRYLERNKQVTGRKRNLVRKLKEDRRKLFKSLEKYMNYGSGSKRVPLQDVLQYALEFVETKPEAKTERATTLHQEDIEMTSLHSGSGGETSQPEPGGSSSSVRVPHLETAPCPRHITDSELNVFQSCLNRWRREVESDVKALQEAISRADSTIREIYNEPSLQQVPYRLHAVLVHEGQAVSGHYWAYVYSRQRESWLKLNDITVTEATWSDLLKESMGGYHNASAYCLMYVDEGSDTLFQGDSISSIKDLEEDLQQYVSSDNAVFCKEKETWLVEMSRKKDSSTMTSDFSDNSGPHKFEGTSAGSSTLFSFPSPHLEHAALALPRAEAQINIYLKDPENTKLQTILHHEMTELRERSQHCPESKVQLAGVYFLQNQVPESYLLLVILEQLLHPSLLDSFNENRWVVLLRKKIVEFLSTRMQQMNASARQLYQDWHNRFSLYRRVVRSFVVGMDKFKIQKYEEAIYHLVDAFTQNSRLITKDGERQRGFDPDILEYYRRKCVLNLNELAVQQFQQEGNFENVITLVDEFIVPAMCFLSSSSASKTDSEAAVQVRDSWCSMIDFHFSEEKRQFLEEIITKLIESPKEQPIGDPGIYPDITDLHVKLKQTMHLIKSDLHLIKE